ncbi:flavohemoglobin expression-modulating QEGLA motif protein [Rhizobium gallicum]|uniref:flavohemoglobin expression-modulating QEGLA motif protein n=1 Tax=Rhizobium gallicum TaxID=56730 RepID=UPI001EF797DE|nr:flavohemoglobin expression-modulating QEGLA motif protein [Rhizobium gallicum]ULJ74633.1 flavohemoglobin expression-modulating QEGLA motif protein [Rhizobium gallicum]
MMRQTSAVQESWLEEVTQCLRDDKPIRKELPEGGRLHIDRLLPFLFIYVETRKTEEVARSVTQSNASYLLASTPKQVMPVIQALSAIAVERFGSFLVIRIGELGRDKFLTDDAPYLPPFEVSVWSTENAVVAKETFSQAVMASEARFRTPRVEERGAPPSMIDEEISALSGCAVLSAEFAPIYRAPESAKIYPELRDQLIATLFDAGLRACAAFIGSRGILKLTSHRSLGRRAFVDAVSRVDRGIDEIASAFDVLLAVTPINAQQAFQQFKSNNFRGEPAFLYRPLTIQVESAKQHLFSVSFDHMEDPVLYDLYREKQREVDLQLSLIASRQAASFIEFGRALYGPVEPSLLAEAESILGTLSNGGPADFDDRVSEAPNADANYVSRRAQAMIAMYRRAWPDFKVDIELRDDLPSGLMVTNHRLLISKTTNMDRRRVEPLLSHEIGVHLLTYFNGSSQGLRLFRSGLSGYEGMQEGLAVFAEFLSGGMTVERLKLIAARVVACADMLAGVPFEHTFYRLVQDYKFTHFGAFNLALRIYRGGGLAKDAIYLRGLLQLLDHLKRGGALEPFWMGKIASSHFGVMEELAARGLLKQPSVYPLFLATGEGRERLDRARQGMRPIDMVQPKES